MDPGAGRQGGTSLIHWPSVWDELVEKENEMKP